MRKKIIIAIFILITIIQVINPIITNAAVEKHEVISVPAKIERKQSEDTVSGTTGLDTITGLILEPAVELVTFIIDAIVQIIETVMTQKGAELVMIDTTSDLPNFGDARTTYTIKDTTPYKNALGNLSIKYPNITYSPEEIFSGKMDLFSIDFISGKTPEKNKDGIIQYDENGKIKYTDNSNSDWMSIRKVISAWYRVLRMISIIGLLSVLIYTGIKIIITSNTKDKAKYKELLINWFIGVILAFSLHYIMAFMLNLLQEIMGLLQGITGVIEVNIPAENIIFKTNLIGLARFQMQQMHFSAKIGYLVMYIALIVYTVKFTFLYLKRVLKMAFLTIISPIVALTYPIDKINGKAQGFEMWLKEYMYNILLQPVHYILYYVLVASSLSLAANNMIYAIAALAFISQAERLLKKIFGFDKATGGTVGGLAGAYATGAITSSLTKMIKNPLHPFGGGNSKGGNSRENNGQLGKGDNDDDDVPNDVIEDTRWEDFFDIDITGGIPPIVQTTNQSGEIIMDEDEQSSLSEDITTQSGPTIPGIDDFIEKYREGLPLSIKELGGLSFEDDPRSIEEILKQMSKYQLQMISSSSAVGVEGLSLEEEINNLESILQWRVMSNETDFTMNGNIPLQYVDGEKKTTRELMDEIINLNTLSNDPFIPSNERRNYRRQSEKLLKILNRRMAQNQYIQRQGGVQAIAPQEVRNMLSPTTAPVEPQVQTTVPNVEQEKTKFKTPKVVRGVANVAKTIAKPVWNVEKDTSYNGKRLAGNILRGVTGVTIGISAAAVQAGISITDGKYNPLEGATTVGAGVVGASKIGRGAKGLGQTYKEGANAGEDGKLIEEYGKQWFNRDDVIDSYNKEFPGQGKQMRHRAVNNYISRGITDFQEQKQAIKYAELLKAERGMNEEEADRLAIATLQYKRNLTHNSNYTILFDEDKREKYLDKKVDTYSGSASRDFVRKLHNDFIKNVRDFDRANR